MNIGGVIKTFIYLISASLLYPVLLLLLVLIFWVFIHVGSFLAEWVQRVRVARSVPRDRPLRPDEWIRNEMMSPRVLIYLRSIRNLLSHPGSQEDIAVQSLLQDEILALKKSLDMPRMVVRIGPGLGLIGTLIPMGTGLAALSQGDMTRLSSDLVVAFTTTVVGLGVGLMAFFIYTIRKRWVEKDIKDMQVITELLAGKHHAGRIYDEIYDRN